MALQHIQTFDYSELKPPSTHPFCDSSMLAGFLTGAVGQYTPKKGRSLKNIVVAFAETPSSISFLLIEPIAAIVL